MQRQFPIDAENRVEQMRYTDFMDLVKPHNPEFAQYVNKKMHESFNFSFGIGTCLTIFNLNDKPIS